MPPAALTSTLSPAELCPDVPSPAYLLFLQTQLTLHTSFLLKGSFPGSDGFSQYLHPPLGLGILLTVAPLSLRLVRRFTSQLRCPPSSLWMSAIPS